MLKIGEFSRLSRVPVKTLRYYADIGLLTPDRVDETTGYRFYAFEQLPRLNRILVLKELGLSLEQIARTLSADLNADELRGMLKIKRAELVDQVRAVEARLDRVEARLRLIETEGQMPEYEVVLKQVDPILIASRRETIPSHEAIGPTLDRTFDEAYGHVGQRNGQHAGPGLALWHDELDAEAAVPLAAAVEASERVAVRELPGAEMACLIHRGSFDAFNRAYEAMFRWVKQHDYQITGPTREVYLKHDRARPDESVTEIQFPVAKAG